LKEQNYCCAICGRSEEELGMKLYIDHEHGKKHSHRGLICCGCNFMIGDFNEKIDNIENTISYLEKEEDAIIKAEIESEINSRIKQCPRCGDKDKSHFHKNKRTRDGLQCYCNKCGAEIQRGEPIGNNKKKIKLSKKERKILVRDRNFKAKYGITLDQYNELFDRQNGRCAICKISEIESKRKKLHLDHDHSSGRIRGILCSSCNAAIGHSYENINILKNAVIYLKKYKNISE
jgi:hypothetical protein